MIAYIEEQYFGDEARLREFSYDRLVSEIQGEATTHPTPTAPTGSGPLPTSTP